MTNTNDHRHDPPPKPKPKLLDTPWRVTEWTKEFRNELKQEIESYKPLVGENSKILLVGPIGAGKSSFVNSIMSLCTGYVVQQVMTGTEGGCITKEYKEHDLLSDSNVQNKLKFQLCDTRGQRDVFMLSDEEFGYLVHGNVPHKYTFNPEKRLCPETDGFSKEPQEDEIPQCVCFLFSAEKVYALSDEMVKLFRKFVKILREKGIQHVVLLTMVDKICSETKKDLSNVYKSIAISEVVTFINEKYGVSENCIVPVKNYCLENELNDAVDILALLALRQMLRACTDRLRSRLST